MGKFYYNDGQILNCTCNYQNGETLSNRKSIFFDTDTYKFDKNKTYSLTDGTNTYKLLMNKTQTRLVFACMDYDISKDYYVNGVISPVVPEAENGGYIYIKCNLYHCSCNYQNGEKLVAGKDIIITADSGYEFNEEFSFTGNDGSDDYYFGRSKDNKTLTYKIDNTYIANCSDDNPTILNDDIVAIKVVQKINHFINLYKISDEEIFQLSNEVWKVAGESETTKSFQGNISALYKYPLKLADVVSDGLEELKIGTYTSRAKGYPLTQNRIELDLGTITVNEEYNNVYDYLNTICVLHLPLFDNIVLESEYVIGQTISIKYIVDLYNGICYIEVSSTFNNNNVFFNSSTKITRDFPYFNKYSDAASNELNSMYLNNIETAFLEVKRNKPYFTDDNTFGKETIETNTLENKKGFVKVNNIILNSNATNEESEKIATLLKDGVVIL